MSEHHAAVRWARGTPDFTYDTYARNHTATFGPASAQSLSAAADFRGDPALPNPEDLLVGALSSCHMLTFLAVCARKRVVVDAYEDDAVGVLEKNADGVLAVTRVVLRPKVTFAPGTEADLDGLHASAHRGCFIANSVKTTVTIEPR